MSNFKYATALAALLGSTALINPANATLQIAATINGVNFFCADNQACDTNATVGILDTGATTIGGVGFSGSEQTQVIGPPENNLTTTSLSITNNTGTTATYSFAVGGTDFAAPVTTYSASGSGTWLNAQGSTITQTWYGDTGNAQGADTSGDRPGTLLTTSPTDVAGSGTDAFSFTHDGAFAADNPYSWTMAADGTLISGATVRLLGRSQDITAAVNVAEPGSLALLGSALFGAGIILNRRRRKDDNGFNDAAA
jgi:hypothetical protein